MPQKRIQLGGKKPRNDAKVQQFLGGELEVSSARGVSGPDQVLVRALDEPAAGRVLVVGTREGVGALALSRLHRDAEVHFFTLDAYDFHRARETFRRNGASRIHCHLGADLPEPGTFDWVLLPVRRAGDAALAGDLMRQAAGALRPRGKVLAAVDYGRDTWLHDRVVEVFGAATIHARDREGTVYIARKQPGHVLRERDFHREHRCRLFGHELIIATRPGVFSHGELDEGSLALSEVAELRDSSRVVDIGCGSGALGIGAALRAAQGLAVCVDSNARAARCARENVAANGATSNCLVVLAHDLSGLRPGAFDVALANPPYFADYRITEHFAREAHRVLAPGGQLHLVTKAPQRPRELLRTIFGASSTRERRGYAILSASRR
jgi:16S rRNA (guanine1207-N2)-methyltransferase